MRWADCSGLLNVEVSLSSLSTYMDRVKLGIALGSYSGSTARTWGRVSRGTAAERRSQMSEPRNDNKGFWAVVKDYQIPRVALLSVHDSEKSALSAQRRKGGRVVRLSNLKGVVTPVRN